MNSKTLIRKALSLCLMVAIYATYSMVALASTERIAGELLISGKNSSVKVNGETAQSGRSIFTASTISTPANTSAIINLGKLGKLELAPNTTANISFTEKGINGDLLTGKITVLGTTDAVNIKTTEGKTVKLNAGESVTSGLAKKDDDDDDDKAGAAWWIWAAIFGGAIAGVVIAATSDNNRVALGGGTTVVSTNR
ncbi:MAG TPA: hypothetical protein VNB22_24270 [Pyrinomonadaceae bacterium]|jgi:hypothetical protein|nr:hypothetical protein [Pyrinomonadaceae bacterium]